MPGKQLGAPAEPGPLLPAEGRAHRDRCCHRASVQGVQAGGRAQRHGVAGQPEQSLGRASKRLAAVDGSSLTVWDLTVTAGRPALSQRQSAPYQGGSAISADPVTGDLLTGTDAGTVTRWSLTSGLARQVTLTGGGTGIVEELATDGRWVVARIADMAVSWDLNGRSSPAARPLATEDDDELAAVVYRPDGALAIGGGNGQITTLPVGPRPAPIPLGEHTETPATAVAWWGNRLVALGGDGRVVAFDPDGRQISLSPVQPGVIGLAATATRLAIGFEDGRIELIGPDGPERLTGVGTSSKSVALSRDGRWPASGTADEDGNEEVLLWDLRHTGPPRHLHGHRQLVAALAFSPDGMRLASGSDDQEIRLWSTQTGRELATLTGHQDTVRTLSFSRDGDTLASTGDEGILRLWDTSTNRPIGHPLPIGDRPLLSLTASPDGNQLVAAGNGQLTAIPLQAAAWRERACTFAGRGLSTAERTRFLPGRSAESGAACQ